MAATQLFVNQLGYEYLGPKNATVACDSDEPQPWRLLLGTPKDAVIHTDTGTFSLADARAAGFDPSEFGLTEEDLAELDADDDAAAKPPVELVFETVRLEGLTQPRGSDPTAGFKVHTVDFSAERRPGRYRLEVGDSAVEVNIGVHIYEPVLRDALRMFTMQRSGYEITPDIAGPEYARAAGHLDVPPNKGDGAVKPLPTGAFTTADGVDLYDGWSGDYTVDARGGWYDAGDMGKYVVNGGISVAQLLGIVERALVTVGEIREDSYAAQALDEALWELDWMARMQVAEGLPYAGMVHHRVADRHWTGIPTMPADDPQERYVHRPSTAATLNFAAVGAQAARVLRQIGQDELAAKYLKAALRAYAAAKENPELYAPDTNVLDNPGSGPYNDDNLDDEWYWAQCCLYLTVGDDYFLSEIQSNPYHYQGGREPWTEVGFDWRDTATWGRIQVAINPLPVNARPEARAALCLALQANADRLIENQGSFGQLYLPADDQYDWGSNGMMANNAAIVAAAYYETGEEQYRDAALEGLDYLFGRNALGISYVTGYGDRYVENQHSRWYAASKDPSLPHPPPGTLSGGPNSACPDPASEHLRGLPAQLCYVDDIDSWGTNEMTINWNAALAWMLAFALDS